MKIRKQLSRRSTQPERSAFALMDCHAWRLWRRSARTCPDEGDHILTHRRGSNGSYVYQLIRWEEAEDVIRNARPERIVHRCGEHIALGTVRPSRDTLLAGQPRCGVWHTHQRSLYGPIPIELPAELSLWSDAPRWTENVVKIFGHVVAVEIGRRGRSESVPSIINALLDGENG